MGGLVEQDRQRLARSPRPKTWRVRPRRVWRHAPETRVAREGHAERPGLPYGWSQEEEFGRKQFAVGGRSPGFITAVQHYPEDGTTIVVLTNSYSSMGQDPVVGDIAALVYGKPAKSGPVAPVKPKAGQFAGVAGRYQMPENYYAPNAILTLKDRGDYLEALWERGEVNIIIP